MDEKYRKIKELQVKNEMHKRHVWPVEIKNKQQKISRAMSVRDFWAVLAKLETKFIQPDVLEYIEIIIRDPKHTSR